MKSSIILPPPQKKVRLIASHEQSNHVWDSLKQKENQTLGGDTVERMGHSLVVPLDRMTTNTMKVKLHDKNSYNALKDKGHELTVFSKR